MPTLCARLQNINEAGTYRLNCPLDELNAAAVKAGFALFVADMSAAQGKGEFLAAVARAISAPDWFGHNFDALADALADLSWEPAAGYVLLLRNGGETLGLNAADHEAVSEIFSATATFWKSQGKAFWVFYS